MPGGHGGQVLGSFQAASQHRQEGVGQEGQTQVAPAPRISANEVQRAAVAELFKAVPHQQQQQQQPDKAVATASTSHPLPSTNEQVPGGGEAASSSQSAFSTKDRPSLTIPPPPSGTERGTPPANIPGPSNEYSSHLKTTQDKHTGTHTQHTLPGCGSVSASTADCNRGVPTPEVAAQGNAAPPTLGVDAMSAAPHGSTAADAGVDAISESYPHEGGSASARARRRHAEAYMTPASPHSPAAIRHSLGAMLEGQATPSPSHQHHQQQQASHALQDSHLSQHQQQQQQQSGAGAVSTLEAELEQLAALRRAVKSEFESLGHGEAVAGLSSLTAVLSGE
eukprot:scaffold24850_cov16-Tisochrysis_lutea.AAC.2